MGLFKQLFGKKKDEDTFDSFYDEGLKDEDSKELAERKKNEKKAQQAKKNTTDKKPELKAARRKNDEDNMPFAYMNKVGNPVPIGKAQPRSYPTRAEVKAANAPAAEAVKAASPVAEEKVAVIAPEVKKAEAAPEVKKPEAITEIKKEEKAVKEVKAQEAKKPAKPAVEAKVQEAKKPAKPAVEAKVQEAKKPAKPAVEAKVQEAKKPAKPAVEAKVQEAKKPAKPAVEAKVQEAKKPAKPAVETKAQEAKKPAKPAVETKAQEAKKPEAEKAVKLPETKQLRSGKFEIKKAKDGRFVFNLYASNHVIIATSQVYSSSSGALNGIKSVIANAPTSPIEDQTLKSFEVLTYPKWEIYQDKGGDYRFRLSASNGSCICHSQGYKAKSSCKGGIESIIKFANDAKIDKSYLKKLDADK